MYLILFKLLTSMYQIIYNTSIIKTSDDKQMAHSIKLEQKSKLFLGGKCYYANSTVYPFPKWINN